MGDKPQSSKEEIHASLGTALDEIEPYYNEILVGIWKRPEKTAGGVLLTQKTIDEDRWQGKVGVVLKKGPMAFKDDETNKFHGADINVGDWVVYRVSDGWALRVNGVDCRMLQDTHIKARVTAPGIIY